MPPDRPAAAPSIPALPPAPVLTARDALELRAALIASDYTVEGVGLALGLVGQAALDRSDLSGAARAIDEESRCATLLRIFVLGRDAPDADVDAALAPLGLARAGELGLIEPAVPGRTRAALDLRPYGEGDGAGSLPGALGPDTAGSWWVLSDLGSDARPDRALRPDHVLGIGAAALTLAQATPRTRVARALDVGTGCGIQALHLSQHADVVVATDISARAVALAQATAALNGLAWEVRQGDLLEPVRGEQFDLIVANPPFVVGPGWLGDAAGADTGINGASDSVPSGYDYRDSGLEGDEISARLVRGLPALLAPGGTAQLLANWIIPDDGDWAARVSGWLEGSGCDAWIWQRELADPGEYVSLWLRDAGETPGTPAWDGRYAQWLDWFDATSTRAVGMGLITLRRTAAAAPVVVCEDVRQAVEQPSGAHIAAWFDRLDWLRAHDGRLGAATLRRAPDLVLTTHATAGPDGWAPQVLTLRQGGGLRWEVDADAAIAALVAGCTGEVTVAELAAVLALSLGAPAQDVLAALTPVLVDLIRRGLLEPTT